MGDLYGLGAKAPSISPLDDLESEEEDREEEIKELLANALGNESFEEDSDTSCLARDESSFRSSTGSRQPLRLSSGRVNGNGNGGLTGHGHILTRDKNGNGPMNGDGLGEVRPREKGGDEMVAQNDTISVLHKTRCPQSGDGPWIGNGVEDNMEQLRTLCEYRERQLIRLEETIEGLSKDKRALNHTVGLLRTEMVHIKSGEEEAKKLLRLKEDEVGFLKGQVNQVLEELKRTQTLERETKDRNAQLSANVGKLQQQVDMLSAIGTSTQQAEMDDVVRQIREKNAKDIVAWKTKVKDLEAQLRVFQRVEERDRVSNVKQRVAETQTERKAFAEWGTQTDAPFESEEQREARWRAIAEELREEYQAEVQLWKKKLEEMPEELFVIWQKNALLSKPLMRDCWSNTDPILVPTPNVVTPVPTPAADRKIIPTSTTETQTTPERHGSGSSFGNSRMSGVSVSVESQTDETLETYRVLAKLVEQWVTEVDDSTKRAEGAERRVGQAEQEIADLRQTLQHLLNLITTARREWRGREKELERRSAETKAHYFRLLGTLRDQVVVLQTQAETPGSN